MMAHLTCAKDYNMYIEANGKSPKDLCNELERLIQNEHQEVDALVIGDLSHIHHQAVCYNGIVVECVEHNYGSTFTLSYSYEWNVYNGCANMNEHDEVHDCISFDIDESGKLEFEHVILEPRTTLDEF